MNNLLSLLRWLVLLPLSAGTYFLATYLTGLWIKFSSIFFPRNGSWLFVTIHNDKDPSDPVNFGLMWFVLLYAVYPGIPALASLIVARKVAPSHNKYAGALVGILLTVAQVASSIDSYKKGTFSFWQILSILVVIGYSVFYGVLMDMDGESTSK